MQLETQRLIIRPWRPFEDVRDAMDIFGDRRVARWLEDDSQDNSLRQVQGRLQRYADNTRKATDGTGQWAAVQKDIDRVIGQVGLRRLPDLEEVRSDHVAEPIADGTAFDYFEMEWHFRPASWGFGYATESAHALVDYGFEQLKLTFLLAIAQPENSRSIAVMRRLGMQYAGLTTRHYGGPSLVMYRLSAPEN
ncbi:MAG: GNAT family N-acetyltransferase [Cyanobacteria bacterium P01_D01_bin.1]